MLTSELFLFFSNGSFFGCYTKQCINQDSVAVHQLSEVIVKCYEHNRRLLEVAVAINYLGKVQLKRFNNTNILPAIKSTPGILKRN